MDIDPGEVEQLIDQAPSDRAVLRFLRWVVNPAAVDALIGGLDSADVGVRAAVLHALARIGDERGLVQALACLGEDEPQSVAASAIVALADLPGHEVSDTLAEQRRRPGRSLLAALALAWRQDARALDVLVEALARQPSFSDGAFRDPAVAMGWLGDSRAVPALRQVIRYQLDQHRRVPNNTHAEPRIQTIIGVLGTFGEQHADDAVREVRGVIPWFRPWPSASVSLPSRQPTVEQCSLGPQPPAHPLRTVPRCSLELHPSSTPIRQPVTKFAGQPVWVARPTWPLTREGTPMTFFAQFQVPPDFDQMAYLFIDLAGDRTWDPTAGDNALFVRPGRTIGGHPVVPLSSGPSYPTFRGLGPRRFSMSNPPYQRFEYRASMEPAFDPPEWTLMNGGREHLGPDRHARNKLGGTPIWLQGDEAPSGDGWRFLFQFSADYIGHELGDGADCYGFIHEDGRGAFLWQCH